MVCTVASYCSSTGCGFAICPGDENNAISTDETLEVEGIQCALTKEDELVMCLGFQMSSDQTLGCLRVFVGDNISYPVILGFY